MTEPPGVSMVNACVNVLPALVIVCDPRPAKTNGPAPLKVMPVPLTQLPYIEGEPASDNVIVFAVREDISTVPML